MKGHFWRDYIKSIVIAIFLALMVRSFIITAYKVPTTSMIPTLKSGDFIFSNRLSYGLAIPFFDKILFLTTPHRGDVIAFQYPDKPEITYVKRVVGLAGDQIKIEQGKLFINGQVATYEDLDNSVIADLPSNELLKVQNENLEETGAKYMIAHQVAKNIPSFGPVVVPPGEVFVLGDNRETSDDSRYWGTIPITKIEGRVFFIWLSLDWQNSFSGGRLPLIRWERVFTKVK